MRPLLARLPCTRSRSESDALDVWHIDAPGVGTLVIVRAGRGRGAAVYEGPPSRAASVWAEGDARARAWSEREAARVREAGGYERLLAGSGLDPSAAETVAALASGGYL